MDEIQIIPLDLVLPQFIKNEIDDSIKTWIKGLTWKTGKEITYDLRLGSVNVPTEVFYDDMTKYEIICKHVLRYYGRTDIDTLLTHTRERKVVEIRYMIFILLSDFTDWSISQAGRNTGGFHHSTVIYGKKVMKNLISQYREYAVAYNSLSERIRESIDKQEYVKLDA